MGLVSDPYTFSNETTADGLQVNERFDAILATLNGAIDEQNLSPAVRAILGLSDASSKRRGATIIAGSEGRTSTSYGLLATPDRVQGVVVPTNGLIRVVYEAEWTCSVNGNGRAAIFIGSSQLMQAEAQAPIVNEAHSRTVANSYSYLSTGPVGLQSVDQAFSGQVSTPHAVGSDAGNEVVIAVAAGTYDVSVQYKSAGTGTTTARNRKLWVEVVGFS